MIAIPQAGRPGFRSTFSRDLCAAGLFLAWALAGEVGAEETKASEAGPSQSRTSAALRTEALLAKLPRFVPPAPPVKMVFPADVGDDVLELPKITVHSRRVAPESDFAWLNAKGRLELSLQTHPGMQLGNVLGLNDDTAQVMQQEERLAAKKADLADRVQAVAFGDSGTDKKIRGLMKALQRRSTTENEYPYLPPARSRRKGDAHGHGG